MKKILFVFIIIMAVLLVFDVRLIITSGPSMEPTFVPGDVLLVCRRFSPPSVGDVVVIRDNSGIQYLKRVTAIAGDTAVAPGNHDDSPCPESSFPVAERTDICSLMHWENPCCLTQYHYWGDTVVPEGYLFVTGDNYSNSLDSRSEIFGLVPCSTICGQVLLKLGSLKGASE